MHALMRTEAFKKPLVQYFDIKLVCRDEGRKPVLVNPAAAFLAARNERERSELADHEMRSEGVDMQELGGERLWHFTCGEAEQVD